MPIPQQRCCNTRATISLLAIGLISHCLAEVPAAGQGPPGTVHVALVLPTLPRAQDQAHRQSCWRPGVAAAAPPGGFGRLSVRFLRFFCIQEMGMPFARRKVQQNWRIRYSLRQAATLQFRADNDSMRPINVRAAPGCCWGKVPSDGTGPPSAARTRIRCYASADSQCIL